MRIDDEIKEIKIKIEEQKKYKELEDLKKELKALTPENKIKTLLKALLK